MSTSALLIVIIFANASTVSITSLDSMRQCESAGLYIQEVAKSERRKVYWTCQENAR